MNDFNLMLSKYGIYAINQENGKFDCFILDNDGIIRIDFSGQYLVTSDENGDVTFTDVIIDADEDDYASAHEVILQSDKYPNVTFYANYFSQTADFVIYRFSSGIILDSSFETPQYKIVFASYNVKTAKVTFVERVLA